MSIPTRTQISNYATEHGLVVEISEPHHVEYLTGNVVKVKFNHPPSTDDGTINFSIRRAMVLALWNGTDDGVLYGPDSLIFYDHSLQVIK